MKPEFIAPESLLSDKMADVRSFGHVNYSVKPHSHEFYEIDIVLKGTGVHTIENNSLNIVAGDVFVIPPFIVHSYENTENLAVHHLLFSRKIMDESKNKASKFPGFLRFIEIEPYIRQRFSEMYYLHLSPYHLARIRDELDFVEDKGQFDERELHPLRYHAAFKVIYYLSYLFDKQTRERSKSEESNAETILKLLEHIHLNFGKKITVEHLCKLSLLSRTEMFRSFKTVCKCTPMEYVNRYRCIKAAELMDTGAFSKTEIAQACGFYDLSHMERTARRFK